MKIMKKAFALLLMLSLLAVPARAADSTVTYTGSGDLFDFQPGSVYTETDLFDGFKQVMPGDVLTETVTVSNQCRSCDYVKIWMGALLHDEQDNPISPKVLEELEADGRKDALTELEYMHDFLAQLTLTVKNGEEVIYQGTPNSLEQGFEGENVYLGRFDYGDSLDLTVELAVDIGMGNAYADRIGEVDWVFVVEEHDTKSPDKPDDPDPTPDKPDQPDDPDIPLTPPEYPGTPDAPVEPDTPDQPQTPDSPKTGDETMVWPYVLLFGAGLVGLILTGKRKEKSE